MMSVFGGDGKKACSKTGKFVLERLCIKNSGHKRLLFINLVKDCPLCISTFGGKKMTQKDLAVAKDKSEAEVSKWLSGLHKFTLPT